MNVLKSESPHAWSLFRLDWVDFHVTGVTTIISIVQNLFPKIPTSTATLFYPSLIPWCFSILVAVVVIPIQ